MIKIESDTERQSTAKYFCINRMKINVTYCFVLLGETIKEKFNQYKFKKLLSYLPNNYEIIVKLHPNESMLRSKYNNLDKKNSLFSMN